MVTIVDNSVITLTQGELSLINYGPQVQLNNTNKRKLSTIRRLRGRHVRHLRHFRHVRHQRHVRHFHHMSHTRHLRRFRHVRPLRHLRRVRRGPSHRCRLTKDWFTTTKAQWHAQSSENPTLKRMNW
jgi:hypothetical protein